MYRKLFTGQSTHVGGFVRSVVAPQLLSKKGERETIRGVMSLMTAASRDQGPVPGHSFHLLYNWFAKI
jgi:hypothetical protein